MKKKILLADDNNGILDVFRLELGEDYEIIKAKDEYEVYKSMCYEKPHILILDVYFSSCLGFSVLKNVKERSNIPVIMMSSLCTKNTILHAWREGANCFLEKPLDFELLKKNIESFSDKAKENSYNNFHTKFSFMNLSGKYRNDISKVIEYVEENFNKDVTLTKLAKIAGITPAYLSRTFKKSTGYTLSDFVTCYRVDIAGELLSRGMSVKETAFWVGYKNEKYFSKVYKKQTGSSPKNIKSDVEKKYITTSNLNETVQYL